MRTARRSPYPSREASGEAPREGDMGAVLGGDQELARRNANESR